MLLLERNNVLATISDRKQPQDIDNDGIIDYFSPVITSTNDYYAFGMLMPGRNLGAENYRFGFNGKEKDDEWHGSTGTVYDYGFRIYDARIAKFLSVDPLTKSYPMLTPYQYASLNPIMMIDIDGLEGVFYNYGEASFYIGANDKRFGGLQQFGVAEDDAGVSYYELITKPKLKNSTSDHVIGASIGGSRGIMFDVKSISFQESVESDVPSNFGYGPIGVVWNERFRGVNYSFSFNTLNRSKMASDKFTGYSITYDENKKLKEINSDLHFEDMFLENIENIFEDGKLVGQRASLKIYNEKNQFVRPGITLSRQFGENDQFSFWKSEGYSKNEENFKENAKLLEEYDEDAFKKFCPSCE